MGKCLCCNETETEDNRLGTLQFPGRRIILVCQECINALWHLRSWAREFDIMEG